MLDATEFLCSTRCYLHYRHNRDDNTITWSAQEEMAARGIGHRHTARCSPAEWMRHIFSPRQDGISRYVAVAGPGFARPLFALPLVSALAVAYFQRANSPW